MAAAQPPHSFTNPSPVAGDSHYQPIHEADLTGRASSSSLWLDRPDDTKRANQTYQRLQRLAQHPHRIPYLSTLIALLRLDDTSWECIKHLKSHQATAEILKPVLPHLYQLPDEMDLLLSGIRSDPCWNTVRTIAIEIVESGKPPVVIYRPSSVRSSAFSSRSSTSTMPSISENSTRSSMSSSSGTDPIYTPASCSSPVPPTPPSVPPKDEKPNVCLSRGCGKQYSRFGDLKNHVEKLHPESQQAHDIASSTHLKTETPTSKKPLLFGEVPFDLVDSNLGYADPQTSLPACDLSKQIDTILDGSAYFDEEDQNFEKDVNHGAQIPSYNNVYDTNYGADYDPHAFANIHQLPHSTKAHQDTIMGGMCHSGPPPPPVPRSTSLARSFSNAKLGKTKTRDSRLIHGTQAGHS